MEGVAEPSLGDAGAPEREVGVLVAVRPLVREFADRGKRCRCLSAHVTVLTAIDFQTAGEVFDGKGGVSGVHAA